MLSNTFLIKNIPLDYLSNYPDILLKAKKTEQFSLRKYAIEVCKEFQFGKVHDAQHILYMQCANFTDIKGI